MVLQGFFKTHFDFLFLNPKKTGTSINDTEGLGYNGGWHENVRACAGAVSPSPAHPTLVQQPTRRRTPHGPGLPAAGFRDTAPWPRDVPYDHNWGKRRKALGVPAAAVPRSTKHATCGAAPVRMRTDETHARRQTLPLGRWSSRTAQGHGLPSMSDKLHRPSRVINLHACSACQCRPP